MTQRLLTEEEIWRERWKADIAARARQQVPLWLQELRREKLLVKTSETPSLSSPITPISGANETGPMLHGETAIIPMTRLLPPINLRDTRELVSAAVRWFHQQHGFLPTTALLNPLRCLALSQSFFAIDCEEIGGYTIEIQQAAHLECDEVWLSCLGLVEDRYLCIPCLANSW